MNREQRVRTMMVMAALVLFGAFLMWWIELQTTGLLIIMFAAGFVLRETLEPITEESA